MSDPDQFLTFRLDGWSCALPLETVERVVRAVEVTPLPAAPAIILGIVNLAGRLLPVLNLRRRFGFPEREVRPSDQFLIAQAGTRTVALAIDEAGGMVEQPPDGIVGPGRIAPGLDRLQGVIKLDGGLILIHNLETFLSLDEARALEEAMRRCESPENENGAPHPPMSPEP